LLDPAAWLQENFEFAADGIICYKAESPEYDAPWEYKPGAWLSEVANPDRSTECGCGINVATLEWCRKNYPDETVWKCLIPWHAAPGIIVPFNTNGKFRVGGKDCLQLVETI